MSNKIISYYGEFHKIELNTFGSILVLKNKNVLLGSWKFHRNHTRNM